MERPHGKTMKQDKISSTGHAGRIFSPRSIVILGFGLASLWLVVEWMILKLLAHQFGWFLTLGFSITKGGLGLVLLAFVLRRAWQNFATRRASRQEGAILTREMLVEPGFAVLGAILIAMPGFVASLFGLSLFSSSIRARLLDWNRGRSESGMIDLTRQDYHEDYHAT